MKRNTSILRLLFLVSFGFAVLMGTQQVLAQTTEPCLPDCYNDQWIPAYPGDPIRITVTLECGEVVEVRIRYRRACDAWNDMYVEGITFVGGYTAAARCGRSMTMKEMLEDATKKVLETFHAPVWTMPQDSGQCVDRWRVMYGSCWQPDFPILAQDLIPSLNPADTPPWYDPQATSGSLWPCEYQICCLDYYRLCNVGGRFEATKYDSEPGQCVLEPPQDPNCEPVCD